MPDDNVVAFPEPVPERTPLMDLRLRESEFVRVRDEVNATFEEHGVTATKMKRWQQWTQAFKAGVDGVEEPPGMSLDDQRAGSVAIEVCDAASDRFRAEGARLSGQIAKMVRLQQFEKGIEVYTPYGRDPLIVAETAYPEGIDLPDAEKTLGEVVLTADGRRVIKEAHNAELGADGRGIEDDGTTPVRYERWWGQGVRVGGAVHEITRKIVRTDAIGI